MDTILSSKIETKTAVLIGGPQDGYATKIVMPPQEYLRVPVIPDIPVFMTYEMIAPNAYPQYEVALYRHMPVSNLFPETKLVFYVFMGIEYE